MEYPSARNYGSEGPQIHATWDRQRTVQTSDTFVFTIGIDMYSDGECVMTNDNIVRHTLGMLAYLEDGTTIEHVFGTWAGEWQTGVRVTSQTANQFALFEAIQNLARSFGSTEVHTVRIEDGGMHHTTWWNTDEDKLGRTIR